MQVLGDVKGWILTYRHMFSFMSELQTKVQVLKCLATAVNFSINIYLRSVWIFHVMCVRLLLKLSSVDKWTAIMVFVRTLHTCCADISSYINVSILLSKAERAAFVERYK